MASIGSNGSSVPDPHHELGAQHGEQSARANTTGDSQKTDGEKKSEQLRKAAKLNRAKALGSDHVSSGGQLVPIEDIGSDTKPKLPMPLGSAAPGKEALNTLLDTSGPPKHIMLGSEDPSPSGQGQGSSWFGPVAGFSEDVSITALLAEAQKFLEKTGAEEQKAAAVLKSASTEESSKASVASANATEGAATEQASATLHQAQGEAFNAVISAGTMATGEAIGSKAGSAANTEREGMGEAEQQMNSAEGRLDELDKEYKGVGKTADESTTPTTTPEGEGETVPAEGEEGGTPAAGEPGSPPTSGESSSIGEDKPARSKTDINRDREAAKRDHAAAKRKYDQHAKKAERHERSADKAINRSQQISGILNAVNQMAHKGQQAADQNAEGVRRATSQSAEAAGKAISDQGSSADGISSAAQSAFQTAMQIMAEIFKVMGAGAKG